jgi:hypothetical protein
MIRAAAEQADLGTVRTPVKHLRPIRAAVVRQYSFDDHAAPGKPAHRPVQKRRGGGVALVRYHLHVRDAAVVVDRDMDILIARAFHRGPAISMDSLADAQDPHKRFDVQMNQFPGPRPLVALHRRGWGQPAAD